jgi:ankyrin repeat protein
MELEDHSDDYIIHKAVVSRDLELLKNLLKLKHDINQRDNHGNSPLHLAIHLRDQEVVYLLLSDGADPLSKNGYLPCLRWEFKLLVSIITKIYIKLEEDGQLFKKQLQVQILQSFKQCIWKLIKKFKRDFKTEFLPCS